MSLPSLPKCSATNAACIERRANVRLARGDYYTAKAKVEYDFAAADFALVEKLTPAPPPPAEPEPHPTEPTEPPPTPPTPTEGFSDVKFEDWIEPGERHVVNEGLPAGGAFRLFGNICKFGQFDPIVYPGRDKIGHTHMFFGNGDVNFDSTYESLARSGRSSVSGDMINRSAYWTPAISIEGLLWVPDNIKVYYKMPDEQQTLEDLPIGANRRGMPEGLKMIFGNQMDGKQALNHVLFSVADDFVETNQVRSDIPADIIPLLKAGKIFSIALGAPYLWDGNLDSPDHRSHLTWPVWNGETRRAVTPPTHPLIIPQLSLILQWVVPEGVDMSKIACSSDMPGVPPLFNFHADYWAVWHPEARRLMFDVFQKNYSTSHADFGNGWKGKPGSIRNFQDGPKLIPMA